MRPAVPAGRAKAVAAGWVAEHVAATPGFAGAFLHGSIVAMADEVEIAPTSDVDLMIVREGPLPEVKPGKTVVSGVILDVTEIAWSDLGSSEEVLSRYHLAGSFRAPTVLADPTGRLRPLNETVTRRFAERRWVRRRCEDAEYRITGNLLGAAILEQWHDRVTAWLFGTGVTTHVLLVAALRNPTVRTRYAAVRDLLAQMGQMDGYERLLALQGSDGLHREQVERHLDDLAPLFDVAAGAVRTPIVFASDISADSRVIAIDGSRDLIARGDHREAVFWIVATYARCLTILSQDAPELYDRYRPGFDALVADLGIASAADLEARADDVRAALPWLRGVAEGIMDATSEITGDVPHDGEKR